jgi:hypothetical protein
MILLNYSSDFLCNAVHNNMSAPLPTDKNACTTLPLPFTWFFECPAASERVQPAHQHENWQPAAIINNADTGTDRSSDAMVSPHWSSEIDEPCAGQLDRGGCPKTAPFYPPAGTQCQKPPSAKRRRPFLAKYPLAKSLRSLAFIFLCECCFLIALNSFLLWFKYTNEVKFKFIWFHFYTREVVLFLFFVYMYKSFSDLMTRLGTM